MRLLLGNMIIPSICIVHHEVEYCLHHCTTFQEMSNTVNRLLQYYPCHTMRRATLLCSLWKAITLCQVQTFKQEVKEEQLTYQFKLHKKLVDIRHVCQHQQMCDCWQQSASSANHVASFHRGAGVFCKLTRSLTHGIAWEWGDKTKHLLELFFFP